MKHWVAQLLFHYVRCDGPRVYQRDGATWDIAWDIGDPVYETGFTTAHGAITYVDQKHPVTECQCSDSVILTREIEEALKEE